MRSLRSWLGGLAFGAALFCGIPSAKAQVPRGITYQGILDQNGAPFSGPIPMSCIFSDKLGNVLFTQNIDPGVVVTNGIFNIVLGPFPESMTFNEQYSMTVVVTDPATGTSTTMAPSALLWSAPYALNAERVAGIDVSPTPVNGDIFPVPLDNGKISAAILPAIANYIQTINGALPDAAGNFVVTGNNGITVTTTGNTVTINGIADGLITSVTGTNGITGGGSVGNLVLGIGAGAITTNMLAPSLGVGRLSNRGASLAVVDSEMSGDEALLVEGGIGANNPNGAADGSGLSSGSPQTYWADQVSVPAATTTTLTIYNALVGASSTIIVTPVGIAAFGGGITITSQSAGTFTVTSKNPLGSGSGGSVTALNYIVVNH